MSNIIVSFPKVEKVNEDFTYSDLHLDLKLNQLITNESEKQTQQVDIQADYDFAAIRNSLVNLFLTSPGDKILNPEFGMDLRNFLFDPVTETIASSISDTILTAVTRFEPRVTITKLTVKPDEDNQQYIINMYVNIPLLQINDYILNLYLNSTGYVTFAN